MNNFEGVAKNTDKQIWTSSDGMVSLHITEGEGLGINIAGFVQVMKPRDWANLPRELETLRKGKPNP